MGITYNYQKQKREATLCEKRANDPYFGGCHKHILSYVNKYRVDLVYSYGVYQLVPYITADKGIDLSMFFNLNNETVAEAKRFNKPMFELLITSDDVKTRAESLLSKIQSLVAVNYETCKKEAKNE